MNGSNTKAYLLGIVGAAVGAAVGYLIFYLLMKSSLYGPFIPQAALGAGAGWFARRRLVPLGVFCAIAGLVFGLFIEWHFFPFRADESLGYFVTHIHEVIPLHLVFIAVGIFFSYRFSMSVDRSPAESE